MTSRIFAANVRATAIANMLADVGALITTHADGTKVLDTSALKTYLDAQLLLVPFDTALPAGVTTDMVAASLRTFPSADYVNHLNNQTRKERFMPRADWPSGYGTISGEYIVSALKTAMAQAETLAAAVTEHYAWLASTDRTALQNAVRIVYTQENIDAAVPPGVTRIINTRTYLYCYRTDKGEISAPSPASELEEVDQNDAVDLTATTPPVGRNIDTILWYRSNSSASDAAFQFLDEVPVASGLTYNDTKLAEALREPCQSFDWLEPPTNLAGMAVHPNGFLTGHYGNTMCFSVANRGYAWPSAYRKTTRTPIVGSKIAGTTVFVGTKGEPYLMTGTDPAFMSSERVSGGQACRSARSIVATAKGFVYAGADGIVLCTSANETPVLTRDHFTKEYWETLSPESIFAEEHDDCYYFWWNNGLTSGCFSLGLNTGKLITVDIPATAVFRNPDDDRLYTLSTTNVSKVFGGAGRRTAIWKSPRISGSAVNFSWKKVEGDFENGALTLTWHRHFNNGTSDTVIHNVATRKPSRLPPGRPDEYEVTLSGTSAATKIAMTVDVEEMKRV